MCIGSDPVFIFNKIVGYCLSPFTVGVVATDVGDNDRMIENGKSGCLTPIKDVTALADAIVALAADGKLRRDFGLCAREILKERYSTDRVLNQYRDLIEEGRKC